MPQLILVTGGTGNLGSKVVARLQARADALPGNSSWPKTRDRIYKEVSRMSTQISAVTLGVKDMKRSKEFYEGLGFEVDKEHPAFISFQQGEGAAVLGLYPREGLAALIGMPAAGSGFAGVVLNYNPSSRDRVDEVLAQAEKAGGKILKPAHDSEWGGRQGHFSDLDGYVWQVSGY
jgi:predicted lactoylglutathione lyase